MPVSHKDRDARKKDRNAQDAAYDERIRALAASRSPADALEDVTRKARRLKFWIAAASLPALAAMLALPLFGVWLLYMAWASDWHSVWTIGVGLTCLVSSFLVLDAVLTRGAYEGPDGVSLTRRDLPDVFALLDTLCQRVGLDPIDTILLTEDVNAFACEHNGKRVLGLGVPLIMLLSPERLLAVMAHEIGHFAHQDTRSYRWACRFLQMDDGLDRFDDLPAVFQILKMAMIPIRVFFAVPAGLLQLAMAKSSRMNEFGADAFAAFMVGRRHAAEALIVINLLDDDAGELIWRPVREAAEAGRRLPDNPFASLPERIQEIYAKERREDFEQIRQRRLVDILSSHPSCPSRVRALGQALDFPEIDAANVSWPTFLGHQQARVIEAFDARLHARFGKMFEERSADVVASRPLVVAALAAIDAADEGSDTLDAAEAAALLIERSVPFNDQAVHFEALAGRFDYLVDEGGRDRVTAVTARMHLLMRRLSDGDTAALELAADLLRRSGALAWELFEPLAFVFDNKDDPDCELGRALTENPDLRGAVRGALEDHFGMPYVADAVNVKDGTGPVLPPAIGAWQRDLIVREVRDALEPGVVVEAIAAAREAVLYGGGPVFCLRISLGTTQRLDARDWPSLNERLCLPGATVVELVYHGEKPAPGWARLDTVPDGLLYQRGRRLHGLTQPDAPPVPKMAA